MCGDKKQVVCQLKESMDESALCQNYENDLLKVDDMDNKICCLSGGIGINNNSI